MSQNPASPDAPAPSPAKKSLKRELTAAIGIPILVWSIGWAPLPVFAAIVILAIMVATTEFVLFAGRDHLVLRLAPPLIAEAVLFAIVIDAEQLLTGPTLYLWLCAIAILFPLIWLWSHAPVEAALPAVTAQIAGTIYVGGLGATMLKVFVLNEWGRRWVGLILIATWAGDMAAYYAGRSFGKHPFARIVSPKKTWEGAIAGALATSVATIVLFPAFFGPEQIGFLVSFGLLLAFFGQIGDLAESMFKRSASVKDSGSLLPGHGGLLDRIDSLLWTGPLVLAVALWWVPPQVGK